MASTTPETYIGKTLFYPDLECFVRITEVSKHTCEEVGDFLFLTGAMSGGDQLMCIEPDQIGISAFVVPEDFPSADIEAYAKAAAMKQAAVSSMEKIALTVPAYEHHMDIPF